MPNGKYPGEHPEAEADETYCGSCQWYKAGFGDSGNCSVTREVEALTLACVEYTEPLMDGFQEILCDKYVLGVRKQLTAPKFNVDDSILEELRNYVVEDDFSQHRFGTQQDLEEINRYLRKIVVNRSRVSTIYTSLIDTKYELEELLQHAELWLYSKYSKMTTLKNEAIRNAAMNRILPEQIPVKKNLKKCLTVAEYIDKKFDSTEFTLSKILASSEKLLFSRERYAQ